MTFKIQELKIKCPFCNKGEINVIYSPIFLKFKKGTYGGGKSGISRTAEKYDVQDKKCPYCGRSAKDIENALKKGTTKEASHEERLKRIRDAGLPTRIEG